MTDQYNQNRRRTVRPTTIHPTFPLDEIEVRKLRRAAIMKNPKLMILSVFGSWFSRRPVKAGELETLFDRVALLWRDKYEDLTMQVIRQMIDESNSSQNHAISQLVEELSRSGHQEYAITLGKFLLLKQRIENELHVDCRVDKRKEELEILVDGICQEVCHEVYRASTLDATLSECLTTSDSTELEARAERLKDSHQRIRQAYLTLKQTSEQIAILLKPGSETAEQREADYLDHLLKTLQQENQLARNIDTRLRTELPRLDR